MEGFLKDRPVIPPTAANIPGGAPPTTAPSPFAALASTPSPSAALPTAAMPVEPQALVGEHGTRIQTVVERGRVVKIVVTCACGTLTEIACQY